MWRFWGKGGRFRPGIAKAFRNEKKRKSLMVISARQEEAESLAWLGHEASTTILSGRVGCGSASLWLRREEGGAQ